MNRTLIPAIWLLFMASTASAQSNPKAQITALSKTIFNWELTNRLDSLSEVFDQQFFIANATGDIQPRDQFLTALESGSFIHNTIAIEETSVTVVNNTATVVGKGRFTVTISGHQLSLHLSYLEVFTQSEHKWKLLALHFSQLPK